MTVTEGRATGLPEPLQAIITAAEALAANMTRAEHPRPYLSPEHEWLARRMTADSPDVPCGTCTACCHSVVDIHPEQGDDPQAYDVVVNVDSTSANGMARFGLRRHADGSCVYLENGRCSIWERRPHVCKTFDCRKIVAVLTRAEERRLVEAEYFQPEIFAAGHERAKTLKDFSRIRALGRKLKLGAGMWAGMQARRGFAP